MTDSFELDTILGFANVAADNAAAKVKLWSENDAAGEPNPAQPVGSVAIFVDVWPADMDSVTLADYPVSDDPSLSDSVIGVQVTIRCTDKAKAKAITSDLFNLFHGRWGGTLGSVRLVSAARRSGASLGQNASGRIGRTENYYLTVHRPSANRQ